MRRSRAILALVILSAACGEPTGPGDGFRVELDLLPGRVTDVSFNENAPSISCDVPIRATGAGKGLAIWSGGVIRFFAGPDRSAPFDSSVFTGADIASATGSGQIASDSTQDLVMQAQFALPFEFEVELRYSVGAKMKKARLRTYCGPEKPSGSVAPPIVSPPVIVGPSLLRIGDSISITLPVASPYALWQTRLVLSGLVDSVYLWAERGVPAATHTIRFKLAAGANLDAALTATVTATDALGARTTTATTSNLILVDRDVPVLRGLQLWAGHRCCTPFGRPQITVGDALMVKLDASDDIALGWLVGEFDTPVPQRDSVPAVIAQDSAVRFDVQAAWAGARSARFYVRDQSGKRSAASISTPTDSIYFYGAAERTRTLLTIPRTSSQAIFDPVRRRLYAADGDNARITVIDAETMTLLASIPLGGTATGLDVSIGGDSILAALPATREVVIVDLRGAAPVVTRRSIQVAPVGGGVPEAVEPIDIKQDANGRWVLLARRTSDVIDASVHFTPSTGATTLIPRDGAESEPYDSERQGRLVRSTDRGRILVATVNCPRIYDAGAATLGPCRDFTGGITSTTMPILSANGDAITVGHDFYDRDLVRVSPNWAEPWTPTRVAYSADGTTIWIAEGWNLDRTQRTDGRRLDRMITGLALSDLIVSADGQWLFLVGAGRDRILRIVTGP